MRKSPLRSSRDHWFGSWFEGGIPESTEFGRFWKKVSGGMSGLTYKSIPRYIHGYQEAAHPRSEKRVLWYPYKQELVYDKAYVPTFRDVLYSHYFPRHLDDDQRVAYIAQKSGRTEEDVANEIFRMRRIRLMCAQSIRMKLMKKVFSPPQGMDFDRLERKYYHASIEATRDLGHFWMSVHSFDGQVMYSPHFGFGDSVDIVFERPLRTALTYFFTDVVVHRAIPRARLPHVKDSPKFPIENIEPCLYEEYKLKMAVMANIAKQEAYISDSFIDTNHLYKGLLVHFYPDHDGEIKHELQFFSLDMDLGQRVLRHYYDNFVAPLRGEGVARSTTKA